MVNVCNVKMVTLKVRKQVMWKDFIILKQMERVLKGK